MSDGDGSGISLEAFARIGTDLGAIRGHLSRIETAWVQRASDVPRDLLLRFAATIPSAGTVPTTLAAMEVGGSGPQPGEVWILRACRIGGITPTTTAAGRGDLYQSPVDPTYGGASGNTASWIDQATTLPLVGTWSSRQIVIRPPDNFYIVITNGTAAQQYVANAQFEVYRDGTAPARVTL